MKTIQLGDRGVALVDDDDALWLGETAWFLSATGYACTMGVDERGSGVIMMHRLIMLPQPGEVVHHRDRNKTNNQRANLACLSRRAHAGLHFHTALWVNRKIRRRLGQDAPAPEN